RQIQAENEKARRAAAQEAQRVSRKAREAADPARNEELEKTRGQIRHMEEMAQGEMERGQQGARDELRDEVAKLAIQTAEKILSENLDADRQRKLVDRFIGQLSKN